MGNVMKILKPVAGVTEDSFGSDGSPHVVVNCSPSSVDEAAEKCIASLHATLVKLLESTTCPESPVSSKLKAVLATAEQQMHKHGIACVAQRRRPLRDVLDEDWLEPHCNFPDTVDFWPPPPPRAIPSKTDNGPRSFLPNFGLHNSQNALQKQSKEPCMFLPENPSDAERKSVSEETNFLQDVSYQFEPSSYSSNLSLNTGLDFSKTALAYSCSRLQTFVNDMSAKISREVQFRSYFCHETAENTQSPAFFGDTPKFENLKHSQEVCSALACPTSPQPFFYHSKYDVCCSFPKTHLKLVTWILSNVPHGTVVHNCTRYVDPNIVPSFDSQLDFLSCLHETFKFIGGFNSTLLKELIASNFIYSSMYGSGFGLGLSKSIHLRPLSELTFLFPNFVCEILDVKRHKLPCNGSSSLEPLRCNTFLNTIKSLDPLSLELRASHCQEDRKEYFSSFSFEDPFLKLLERLCYSSYRRKDCSFSSSNEEVQCHYTCSAMPAAVTRVGNSSKENLPSVRPSMANEDDFPPASSSRLTCPRLPLSKLQLLLMLLEPVAHFAASHRRATHEALCDAEVCAALLGAVRLPDVRVQETAAKAVANIACSAQGAALLSRAGAPGALRPCAGSPCLAVQLAASRALLNLRRLPAVDGVRPTRHVAGASSVARHGLKPQHFYPLDSDDFGFTHRTQENLNSSTLSKNFSHPFSILSSSVFAKLHNCSFTKNQLHNFTCTNLHLQNCLSIDLLNYVLAQFDLQWPILCNLVADSNLPNSICSYLGRTFRLDSEINDSHAMMMNFVHNFLFSNELKASNFLSRSQWRHSPSHEPRRSSVGVCRRPVTAWDKVSRKHVVDARLTASLHDELPCEDRPVRVPCSGVPLQLCDHNNLCSLLTNAHSWKNFEVAVLARNLHENTVACSEELPVYEEGIYPILLPSDLLQLIESIPSNSDESDFVRNESRPSVSQSLAHVSGQFSLASQSSDDSGEFSTGMPLVRKCVNITTEKSRSRTEKPIQKLACTNGADLVPLEDVAATTSSRRHEDVASMASSPRHEDVASMASSPRHEDVAFTASSPRHEDVAFTASSPRHEDVASMASSPRHEDVASTASSPHDGVVDVVLLHGILGGAAWTWRQDDCARRCTAEAESYTWCWPRDWLAEDVLRASGTRLRLTAVNIGEPLRLWDLRSLHEEARRVREALVRAGVGRRPVVWLAHSHGGLLLQAVLGGGQAAAPHASDGPPLTPGVSLSSQTAGVVFLSTPHRGSPWAWAASHLHPHVPELRDLCPDNALLAEVTGSFERCWQRHKFAVLSLVDTEPLPVALGLALRPVPARSAAAGVGNTACVASNHLNICKPLSRDSDVYKAVLQFCVETASFLQ